MLSQDRLYGVLDLGDGSHSRTRHTDWQKLLNFCRAVLTIITQAGLNTKEALPLITPGLFPTLQPRKNMLLLQGFYENSMGHESDSTALTVNVSQRRVPGLPVPASPEA